MSNYLFVLFLLACPLMMIFMMRGMHGGHGDTADRDHEQRAGDPYDKTYPDSSSPLDDLRRRRDELDRQIEEREGEELTPVGSGWR
jgi:hypothetical protein